MSSVFGELLGFINELDQRRGAYRLAVNREDAVTVEVAVPGERWEVEFLSSGEVEVERFKSSGDITGSSDFSDLWELLE